MRSEIHLQQPSFTAEHINVLQVSREKGYTHSYRNGRTMHGFILIFKGSMQFSLLPEGTLHATQGQLVFMPKGSTYSGTYLEDQTELRIVQFDISGGSLPSYLQAPVILSVPQAEELMGAFFRPGGNHALNHPFYSLSCFYSLLWQIDERCTKIPSRYKKLLSALSELSAHWEENHPIAYYAALCHMSEPNFRRLFREYTGQSPVEYRNSLRLSAAQTKLQSGEYNVTEAAEASGFTNLSFFIRLYKKKYGYSPKKE